MSETNLLNKISQSLKNLCEENNIKRIDKFALILSHNSQVNEEILRDHLKAHNKNIISAELGIEIKRDDITEGTAILYGIQGS